MNEGDKVWMGETRLEWGRQGLAGGDKVWMGETRLRWGVLHSQNTMGNGQKVLLCLLILRFILFVVMCICMSVSSMYTCVRVPKEVSKGHWVPWSWWL